MIKVKKDCFAYDSICNRCKALKDTYCKYEECRFYKTKNGGKKPPCTTYKP